MKSASKILVSTFGSIIGLMGIEHGIGEILQGPVSPAGLSFSSWPDAKFFEVLSGEPAFSLVQNMLVTGILACLFSIAFVLWVLFYPKNKHSSLVMITLAILMFLTGGGFFPPFFAIIIGLFANRLHQKVSTWHPISQNIQRILSLLWPWTFGLCLAIWLAMFPGVPSVNYFFDYASETLTYAILIGMILFLILANFTAKARDLQIARQK
jgi:MFS family permease